MKIERGVMEGFVGRAVGEVGADAAALLLALIGVGIGLSGCLEVKTAPEPDVTVTERALTALTGVVTQHNNLPRTGANLNETILTTSNVHTGTFGKLHSYPVTGQVYAQPLYVAQAISGKNVVYIATEANNVYAFNADSPWDLLWSRTTIEMPWMSASTCVNTQPLIGISSTPVIDTSTNTIYLTAKRNVSGTFKYMLHALDLTTGADKPGSPIDMGLDANGQPLAVSGSGDGMTSGQIVFDPIKHQNRVGLTLSQGVLTVGFASHCDQNNYHGWVLRFDTTSSPIRPLTPYMTNPNTGHGGLWQGGGGFPVDSSGNLYMVSGDGRSGTTTTDGTQLANAFIKLTNVGVAGTPTVGSWFMPSDVASLDNADSDIGSSGPMLIPNTSLMIGGGKNGVLYVVNTTGDMMGHFLAGTPPDTQIVQRFPGSSTSGQIVGGPTWWDGPAGSLMYVWPGGSTLGAFSFNRMTNLFNTTAVARGPDTASGGDAQGGQVSLSASGSTTGTGIVWATRALGSTGGGGFNSNTPVGGALYAYNAENVATKLWDSTMVAADKLANAPKYIAPTIANGKVYVGTLGAAPSGGGEVAVYGLFNPPDGGVGGSSGTGGAGGAGGAAVDAGMPVVDSGSPLSELTCGTVDGGATQPTTWTYVYNTYFAGTTTDATAGHCGECHGSTTLGGFLCGTDKDSCYAGLVSVGMITPASAVASPLANPDQSPLAWFGRPTTPPGVLAFMPTDLVVTNPPAVAALCGWVQAGAHDDKTSGQACGGANECASGFCVDGICCGTACASNCTACSNALTGQADGTCAPVVAGGADDRCSQSPPCGNDGTCNGAGACKQVASGTSCAAAFCSAGTGQGAGACNGTGSCVTPSPQACAPFVCGTTACKTTCAADTDCIAGDACSGSTCIPKKATYQIDSGSSSGVSPFSADEFASGGTMRTVTSTITTTGVTNAAPAAVYQSERFGTSTYTIPSLTASASYMVRLHFAELFWTATGKRVFNVLINGAAVLSGFDVFATAGGEFKALVRDFAATATASGQIVINFTTVTDNATIEGIEIIPAAPNTPPTVVTAASASPNPVAGSTAALSVLGSDDGGEANLTYTWAPTGTPPAAVTFGANGTNSAKATMATFSKAGAYSLQVTIKDQGGLTATSTVSVVVNQTLTSIVISPASATIAPSTTQQFAATARDQFMTTLTTQPAFTWSLSGGGTISSSGLYTTGTTAGGPFNVSAQSGSVTGTASVSVVAPNAAPTIATAAAASPTPVSGSTTAVSVLGADDQGEANLVYTWTTTGTPPAAVTFSANGTNAAKASTATFTEAGSYAFQVTVKDQGGLTVTSSVNITVNQTLTSLVVSPASATVATSATQQFTATARDQFTTNLTTQPSFTWSASGGGTISSGGFYTAGTTAGGPFTVTAQSGAISGTGSVTVSSTSTTVYRIDSGSSSGVSPFTADQFFSGGTARTVTNSISTSGLTNAAPQGVYQTERFGNVTYTIPSLVASAQYTVRLHFAELFWTATGKRAFNVAINGTTVLANFDIFATTGAEFKATLRDFTATANASGQIVIKLTTVTDNATVEGIEIIRQ